MALPLPRVPLAALAATVAAACGAPASAAPGGAPATIAGAPVHTVERLSPVYTVDRMYRSMTGPYSQQQVLLDDALFPELLWIVGYEARMVGPDGTTPLSQEFMCHSNLDLDMERHRQLFGWNKRLSGRLFTLSQGQFEIAFPEGFGIPVLSNEPLQLTTQVLNHNLESPDLRVRHRVTIRYVRDADLERPLQALYPAAATGLVRLDDGEGYYGVEMPHEETQGPGCLPGQKASARVIEDAFGRRFSGHWVVPPGRQVNRTLVSRWMDLPFDTTLHYVAVHLHPFAESLELRDLTTGETLFRSRARGPEEGIGLVHVDAFSSAEGVPVYRDHEYELVSVYDNTSGEDQDSMAVMYLYLRDPEFQRPALLLDPRDALGAASGGRDGS